VNAGIDTPDGVVVDIAVAYSDNVSGGNFKTRQ
jgi:hypothetical protein